MQLFYTTDIQGDLARLDEEEARHCVQVLRHKRGDRVHFIDGMGGFFTAEIIETGKKNCMLKIVGKQENFGKRSFHLHIAIAPTKNLDRFEWFLEKAAETGIDEITPLVCMRSERRKLRSDRLQKILLSAVKQSVKAFVPKLNDLTDFREYIKKENFPAGEQCFIATLEVTDARHVKHCAKPGMKTTILIGPEGGFSPEEIGLSLENKFIPVKLGQHRLRTETAGVIACHALNFINET